MYQGSFQIYFPEQFYSRFSLNPHIPVFTEKSCIVFIESTCNKFGYCSQLAKTCSLIDATQQINVLIIAQCEFRTKVLRTNKYTCMMCNVRILYIVFDLYCRFVPFLFSFFYYWYLCSLRYFCSYFTLLIIELDL